MIVSHRVEAEEERGHHAEVAATPRIAQKRSAFSFGLAVTRRPVGEHDVGSSRLSIVRPSFRVRWPMPPPSVSPPTPVVEMMPLGVARPNAWVA